MSCCAAWCLKLFPFCVCECSKYLCVGALWNRRRQGVVDLCCSRTVVLCSGVTTLGSQAGSSVGMLCVGVGGIIVWLSVTTLGACTVLVVDVPLLIAVGVCVSCVGIMSTLLSCVAISNSAFRTGSPAFKLGIVVAGSEMRMVTMSSAACRR